MVETLTLLGIENLSVLTEDIVGLLDTIMFQLPWLFVAWMTGVGGAIGSFLNVVVYRMPAGMSISHPPSRCPKCETPIRAYDNIPVLGWLILRGKCRKCKLPIATRYPLVEGVVGILFGALAFATVFGTRANSDVLFEFTRFLYYANAVACLVAFALIDFDGHRFPVRLVVYASLTILVIPMIHDGLRIWAIPSFLRELPFAATRGGSIATLVLHAVWYGLGASIVSRRMRSGSNLIVTGALLGIVVGWLTPAIPLLLVSAVGSVFFRQGVGANSDAPHSDDDKRRLAASVVTLLVALTYMIVVVQLYRGDIIYSWHS